MELSKDNLNLEFVKGNIGEFYQNFLNMVKKPKDYFQTNQLTNVSQDSLLSAELLSYAILLLSGLIESFSMGIGSLLPHAITFAIMIYLGPFLLKALCEFFESPPREILYYRNYIRFTFGFYALLILAVRILPLSIALLLIIPVTFYSIYISNIALKIELKVSDAGRKVLIGLTSFLSVITIVAAMITVLFIGNIVATLN
jgi:hypothetical protein